MAGAIKTPRRRYIRHEKRSRLRYGNWPDWLIQEAARMDTSMRALRDSMKQLGTNSVADVIAGTDGDPSDIGIESTGAVTGAAGKSVYGNLVTDGAADFVTTTGVANGNLVELVYEGADFPVKERHRGIVSSVGATSMVVAMPNTSKSTQSLHLNAGTPATDQHYINGPAFTALYAANPTVISFAFWFKNNDTEAVGDMIFGGCSDYDVQDDGFGVFVSATDEFTVYFEDSNPATGASFVGDFGFFDGQWHHMAVTWDTVTNQTPLVWIDGVVRVGDTDSDFTSAVARGTGELDIGRMGTTNSPSTAFLDFEIDDVVVYSSILTVSDALALYNGRSHPNPNKVGSFANLLLWWPCGEAVGDDADDTTGQITDIADAGNAHHGTPLADANDPVFSADVTHNTDTDWPATTDIILSVIDPSGQE